MLRASPYLAEAIVFGHARKYLTALIEIDFETVADWARSQRRGLHRLHQPGAAPARRRASSAARSTRPMRSSPASSRSRPSASCPRRSIPRRRASPSRRPARSSATSCTSASSRWWRTCTTTGRNGCWPTARPTRWPADAEIDNTEEETSCFANSTAAVAATLIAAPAVAQDAYVDRPDRRADRAAGQHLRAGRRGAAHLYRARQRRRRHQRQEGQPDPAGRLGRARQGRGQRQEADRPGQRDPAAQCQPVLDLRAGRGRGQARGRADPVCQLRVPEGRLPAGRPAAVLHHRVRRHLRQPRHPRLHQGDRQGAGQDRLLGHGDPAVARRDGLRRSAGAGARHDGRRQGGDPAADARLHAVRHQAQGRRRQLGVLVGAVGDAGAHARGAAPPRLAGRLHRLVAHRGGRASWRASRTASSTSSAPTRCSRTQLPIHKEIADAVASRPTSSTRRSR